MEHREQLEWEARAAKAVGIVAILTGLLPVVSQIYVTASLSERPSKSHEILRLVDEETTPFIVGGAITALALVGLLLVLGYLYRATKYRRPQLMRAAAVLMMVGCVGSAGVIVWRQVEYVQAAHEFVDNPPRVPVDMDTKQERDDFLEDEAEDAVRDRVATAAGFGLGANLALGFAIVMISLNAMRAGLLSRFMGILGIIIGGLYAIPLLGGPQVLQLFWMPALGFLLLGRWPGGRGPAWETGEEEPWPSAAQLRAEQKAEQRAQEPGEDDDYEDEEDDEAAERDGPRHPSSKKRKRKRRR